MSARPLVAHVVHRFALGGMENGMVNLLNHLPEGHSRHVIICLEGYTDYCRRIRRPDLEMYALNRRTGIDLAVHKRTWQLLRRLRPDVVHTRNLSTLETQAVAAAAGVRGRIHGEHGRDMFDLDGRNRRYNWLRRAMVPLVTRYIAVSQDLEAWLTGTIGAPARKVAQIYNGVDIERFAPRSQPGPRPGPPGFAPPGSFIVGAIGRMAAVKDHETLVRAFIRLVEAVPQARHRLRLMIVGEGLARQRCMALLASAGLAHLAWLPGERADIPELLSAMDVFALPSLGEGISNTLLEAMACGVPVIATDVGGNPELVAAGETGTLVPVGDELTLSRALADYFAHPERARREGQRGRSRVETRFSMQAMVAGYLAVYDEVLGASARPRLAAMRARSFRL
ncbi:MAG: TIGR03088 family PEP-CTERM/XrtA system glycosyltransferase [Betaproteobacteria bacterium]|nr:TIGR03088 family PEP-CTERM/XrtA system glycosyltransferase [Betaproteobacteria bacterium]